MKNKIVFIIIGLIIIAGGYFVFSDMPADFLQKDKAPVSSDVGEKITLSIDSGDGNIKTVQADLSENSTVYDLLKNGAQELGLPLNAENFDTGVMIKTIGDKENGQDGKYWLYYVNGEMPMVSADKEELKSGDKVEFKFEKSPF